MKILVCLSFVPDTTSKISFTEQNTQFNKSGVQFIIGPYDEYALSKAVDLKESAGAEVVVINVGNADEDTMLRKALAIGADSAVRINAFPIDSFFVASQIAHYAKDKSFDMILMGRESIDFNGGLVHGMVAELLGIPYVNPAMKLTINGNSAVLLKEIDGGKEEVEVNLPFVAGCQEPIAEWRIPGMKGIMSAKSKPLTVLDPIDTETMVFTAHFDLPPAKTGCKMIDSSNVEQLIQLLKTEAKVL